MTPLPPVDHDRLLELLADRTLVGLDAGEQQELESLLQANPDFDTECLDRTAALLDRAAAAGDTEPLPEQLQDRIRAGGRLGLQTRPSAGDGSGGRSRLVHQADAGSAPEAASGCEQRTARNSARRRYARSVPRDADSRPAARATAGLGTRCAARATGEQRQRCGCH